ncbi:MAG: hypothetical protein JNJ50_18240, partial [Acidobacteria bacterium]|nr:hypothetical protein [Acidobacteriota bacterium]
GTATLLLLLIVRIVLALQLGQGLLKDNSVARSLWLVPLQDLLSFASWVGGFSGREIVWRHERYRLSRDGRFTPVTQRSN